MDVTADLAPTGSLRAAINLGNPVLAQGTRAQPTGVTVDLARELAAALGVPVEFVCFDAARESFEALRDGRVDVGFLAIEPERAEVIAFTAAYAVIEGVFAVAEDSPIATATEVDRPGVRVGVKAGSAYDLFLTRTLEHAEVVRGEDGVTAFVAQRLEVAAGIRQPVEEFVAAHPGTRVLEPRFMEIRQAVGTTRAHEAATLAFVHEFVEARKADGFVAEALRRSGRLDAVVAPPSARTG